MAEDARTHAQAPQDAVGNWVDRAPDWAEPYLRLSRYDRPVGFWLLALPCWIGLAFTAMQTGLTPQIWTYAALFALGAIAMRGAGCTYNDMLDRDIDAKVARTAQRPLASGRVSIKAAWIWLALQCGVGLCVLLALPRYAQIVSLAAIPLVAAYPVMKRITWWPQAWLGLTFNWGALVAPAAAKGRIDAADLVVYLALAAWTLGYDTIYALQDKEDDALIGVRSTARRFGANVRAAVSIAYALAAAGLAAAAVIANQLLGLAGAALFAAHLAGQAARVRPDMSTQALAVFKSNRSAALLLVLAWGFIGAAN